LVKHCQAHLAKEECILGLLRIIEDYALNRNKTTKPAPEEILTAPTLAVYNETVQIVIPKSMVLDLG